MENGSSVRQLIPRTGGKVHKQGFKQFQYLLLPGRCPRDFSQVRLHNMAFNYWRDFWNSVFAEISPGETVNEADFFRQNGIGVFLDGDRIAALHLYSFWNLESEAAIAQPYFRLNYNETDLARLKEVGVREAMSMEYLTIDPRYRKSETGFPMSSMVIGVGLEMMRAMECDAMIAPCRVDMKIDLKAADFGAYPLREPFALHGVPVVNVVAPRWNLKESEDATVATAVRDHWQRYQNYKADLPWAETDLQAA